MPKLSRISKPMEEDAMEMLLKIPSLVEEF
jgi:hypothetical protein